MAAWQRITISVELFSRADSVFFSQMRVTGLTAAISWCYFLILSVVHCGVLTFWTFHGKGCRYLCQGISYLNCLVVSGRGSGVG